MKGICVARGVPVFTRRELTTAGVSDHQLRQRLHDGRWRVLLRGVYVTAETWTTMHVDERERVRCLTVAAALRLGGRVVAGHAAAATLHRVPVLDARPGGSVTVLRAGASTTLTTPFGPILVRQSTLSADDVAVVAGVPATRAARTVLDLARTRGFEAGVLAADYALHEALTTYDALTAQLRACWSWSGIRAAARAVGFADARSESPLESLARICFGAEGLPAPLTQAWIGDEFGEPLYRVDFTMGGTSGDRRGGRAPEIHRPSGPARREVAAGGAGGARLHRRPRHVAAGSLEARANSGPDPVGARPGPR